MRNIGLAFFLFLFTGSVAVSQGIDFQHISYEEALQEAQKQDKLIFIDFYTDWCAPCKALAKGPFLDKELGDYYNQNFISLKLNAEKEGGKAARKYGVKAYPTLMFVNAKGNMVYKTTGLRDVASLIQLGQEALNSVNNELSLENLKEQFPSKQDDEKFLKLYYQKMIEYGASPVEGIEAWLKVQTEIKEADVDMMEFLMKHRKYLLLGGKAEQILQENYDEYWDIATKAEEQVLENFKYNLATNTQNYAYKTKSPETMRLFITSWKQLPEKINRLGGQMKAGNLTDYEMEYLLLAKDYSAFKKMAEAYLDSLISAKSLEQIRLEDKATYEDYKATKYAPSIIGNATLKRFEQGKEARSQQKAIVKTANYYLSHCEKSKEYKRLYKWIDYGSQLIAGDYQMDNLRASVLQKQGKLKEAIKYKEAALSKLSKNDRNRATVQNQLDKMKRDQN
ncbi:thioredoxin family protein [Carboxylicivirga sp. A043]|uniref:thioredoxin family protein n=1 Tax=Carboxylicivirga litoralis TaxID=2816963 RepID=UPI0021CB6172|nr:thioredoxin family protein [Carboxylicivirga sp. A043]MCU4155851.1 thioredoxin family protein [Carboxylicivirga sp. A043]